MGYTRKNTIIQYNSMYVAGYSFKTGKVYFVTQKEFAKKFTPIKAQEFLSLHICEDSGFLAENITLILIDWREKFAL